MTEEAQFRKKFSLHYGGEAVAVCRAPGRLEILGNHTDYNDGLVLSAAVSQATWFGARPVDGNICRMTDFRDGSSREFDLDNIDKPVKGDWTNYIKGVICELRRRGHRIGAFDGAIESTIPLSAGMSSSAALEISSGLALGKIFGIELAAADWARVGQASENKYIGVQSGLLDQFSSLFGKKDHLILCDFRTVEVIRTVPVPQGQVFVVANSMVKHDLVDSDYNKRRESCERVVAILREKNPEINALRDVSSKMLDKTEKMLDQQDYLRAKHVVGENERVETGVKALEKGELNKFGKLLYESHRSSRENFANSCPELDCLVELSTSIPGCCGARLSGGGFGGISIHLVQEDNAEKYCARIKEAYRIRTGKKIETIVCGMGNGALAE